MAKGQSAPFSANGRAAVVVFWLGGGCGHGKGWPYYLTRACGLLIIIDIDIGVPALELAGAHVELYSGVKPRRR